jgi:ribonuclease-3
MGLWSSFRKILTGSGSDSDGPDLDKLQKILGYRFRDPELLHLGLTHRSLVRSNSGRLPSNERLEFLGDSVLGLVVADQLYRDNPRQAEGSLTKTKAMLVNETALSRVAGEIGFNEFILLSPEEERSGGRERPSIVSDAFEAVIGAIFIDGGLEAARRMIRNTLYARRQAIMSDIDQQNFKGDLLELVQASGGRAPRYEVMSETGPDHDKLFHVVVTVDGEQLGDGRGSSKKDAEQKAAHLALQRLQRKPLV